MRKVALPSDIEKFTFLDLLPARLHHAKAVDLVHQCRSPGLTAFFPFFLRAPPIIEGRSSDKFAIWCTLYLHPAT